MWVQVSIIYKTDLYLSMKRFIIMRNIPDSHQLKLMMIAVILSVPIPVSVSLARISSSIYPTGTWNSSGLGGWESSFPAIFTAASSLVKQSQIPSQAQMINLSSAALSTTLTSGSAVTACSDAFLFF